MKWFQLGIIGTREGFVPRVRTALAGQAPGAECVAADVERYKAWLAKYVSGVKGFGEYLDLCGGLSRMQELRRQELLLNQQG